MCLKYNCLNSDRVRAVGKYNKQKKLSLTNITHGHAQLNVQLAFVQCLFTHSTLITVAQADFLDRHYPQHSLSAHSVARSFFEQRTTSLPQPYGLSAVLCMLKSDAVHFCLLCCCTTDLITTTFLCLRPPLRAPEVLMVLTINVLLLSFLSYFFNA